MFVSSTMFQYVIAVFLFSCICLDMGAAQTAPVSVDNNLLLSVDNFILLNRRQYANVIGDFDRTVASFRQNYVNQVRTIDSQSTLLEKRLNDVAASLNPLDVLSPDTRVCVQKYRSNIANVATIKATIAACAASATNSLATFVAPAQTTRNNLNNYYVSNFEQLLANCKRVYPPERLLSNYTSCVETTINTVNTVTITNQKLFDTQIQTAQCSSDSQIRLSIDCSYTAQFSTISAIGEYTRLINNCIAGLDKCAECKEPTVASCGTFASINATEAAKTIEKINNPFRDLNANATCVVLTKSN